jgi:hypothetical protein
MLELVIKIFQMFSDGRLSITKDTTIHDMNALPYHILDLATVVIIIQVIYAVDIPGHLIEMPELTIEEFVVEVGKLPRQEDELFIARTIKFYVDFMGHRSYRQQLN